MKDKNNEKTLKQIDDMEDILISKIIKERDEKDDGVRYSFDEIKRVAEKRLEE